MIGLVIYFQVNLFIFVGGKVKTNASRKRAGGALAVCAHVRRRAIPYTPDAAQVSPVHYQNNRFFYGLQHPATIVLCEGYEPSGTA